MAALLQYPIPIGPSPAPTPVAPGPCSPTAGTISCQALTTLVQQCGQCGGTTPPCTCGGHPQPCGAGEALNSCGCCAPSGTPCPPGTQPPCPAGYVVNPQTGCCVPGTCACGGHPQPCASNESVNSCGCCVPVLIPIPTQGGCPSGDVQVGLGQPCPQGYINDPLATPPAGFICCMPSSRVPACPPGTAPPCATGYALNPQTGCCAPEAVEACFVCPGGLPELASALQGAPNSCYLASQMFYPPGGALPAAA